MAAFELVEFLFAEACFYVGFEFVEKFFGEFGFCLCKVVLLSKVGAEVVEEVLFGVPVVE